MAGQHSWTASSNASGTASDFGHGSRICDAIDAQGAIYFANVGADFARASVHAEARRGRASTSYPKSRQGNSYERRSEGWSDSHQEPACGSDPFGSHAQGLRRFADGQSATAQQLEEILVGCRQIMARI